jgi:hypothetical protein
MKQGIPFPMFEDRSAEEIRRSVKDLIPYYVPQWRIDTEEGDAGYALVKIFSHMWESVAQSMNKAPQKYFTAFLDAIGIRRFPPNPAQAPVTFTLTEGTANPVLIPAKTRVAAGETVFETRDTILATPAQLIKTLAVNPLKDEIYDIASFPVQCFGGQNLQQHVLYIGQAELLEFKGPLSLSLSGLTLAASQLPETTWQYWSDQWLDFDKAEIDQTGGLRLTKNNNDEIKELEIDGITSRWLRCKVREGRMKSLGRTAIQPVKIVREAFSASGIAPDMLFHNDVPPDLENMSSSSPVYPFGKIPRLYDAFYIGSSDVLSQAGSEVTLTLELQMDKGANPAPDPVLSWEYWDGEGWLRLPGIAEHFSGIAAAGTVKTITIPSLPVIEKVKVHGRENHWLRVRLVEGHYGQEFVSGSQDVAYEYNLIESAGEGKFKVTPQTKKMNIQTLVPGVVTPPKITKISFRYKWESAGPALSLGHNNLVFQSPAEDDQPPFSSLDDRNHTLYLGFDKKMVKGPFSLFFSFDRQAPSETRMPKLLWYYYSGDKDKGWSELQVTDNTQQFSRAGTVEFFIPPGFETATVLGRSLFWLKAVDIDNNLSITPLLRGIYVNTVWTAQQEHLEDEIIGSGDFTADQGFVFKRKPVISGEIWVDEKATLTQEEKTAVRAEQGEDAVIEEIDEEGDITAAWVRWQSRDDFYLSSSKSRHYVMDRAAGSVKFGNGINGKLLPAGKDNIKASYRVGGGAAGNVGVGEIAALKSSVPNVAGVFNPLPAEGGAGMETPDAVFTRGPHLLKHRGRAVTLEDFQRIAAAASSQVARTRCYWKNSRAVIYVIPEGEEAMPMPSDGLLKVVEQHLIQCTPATVSDFDVVVRKPVYKPIRISADIIPQSADIAVPLEKEVVTKLQKYLHPLTGGPGEQGWEFGRDLHFSDIYALLEDIAGVDHVENLLINGSRTDVSVEEHETICPGKHHITIVIEAME